MSSDEFSVSSTSTQAAPRGEQYAWKWPDALYPGRQSGVHVRASSTRSCGACCTKLASNSRSDVVSLDAAALRFAHMAHASASARAHTPTRAAKKTQRGEYETIKRPRVESTRPKSATPLQHVSSSAMSFFRDGALNACTGVASKSRLRL